MVRGIDVFRSHFGQFGDSFVLIGGTACALIMESSSVQFRQTKDIDMVLHIEVLSEPFFRAFMEFIKKGNYGNIQMSTGKRGYYRFLKPVDTSFPAMIELFARKPELITLKLEQHITPIPAPEAVSDLSAILMNDEYYDLIFRERTEINGLPVVPAAFLIPLKAHAWLNLTRLQREGKQISSVDIVKHKKDVFRLSQMLAPDQTISLSNSVAADIKMFFDSVEKEPFNTGDLDIRSSFETVLAGLRLNYGCG